MFDEIHASPSARQSHPSRPDQIEVYVSHVEPRFCSHLVKQLSGGGRDAPLAHLKRVRRRTCLDPAVSSAAETESLPATKKQKKEVIILQVLLGPVEDASTEWLEGLQQQYKLQIETQWVPGRPASCKEELEEFNKLWPTHYFHEQSEQHLKELLELRPEDLEIMQKGMQCAMEDAKVTREYAKRTVGEESRKLNFDDSLMAGVVVLCPKTGNVVSRASDELKEQSTTNISFPPAVNPLSTPTLLAIQGVSRLERAAAAGYGMDSETFKTGQYLCTGFDVYMTEEPSVFEAMALVHSRVQRVIFGVPNTRDGGLGGTGESRAVHSLPGTNHHYRAFVCSPESPIRKQCEKLHPTPCQR